MLISKSIRLLVIAYILSLGFTQPLALPAIAAKASLPELLFIPLFALLLIGFLKKQVAIKFASLDLILCLLVIIHFISSFFQKGTNSYEASGTILYLFVVYLTIKQVLIHQHSSIESIQMSIIASCVLAASPAIGSWLAYQAGFDNPLISSADCYFLYAPNLTQATGFMATPNMLLNFLATGFLACFSFFRNRHEKLSFSILILLVLATGMLLTFSKSLLFFLIAVMFFVQSTWFAHKPGSQWIVRSLCVFLFVAGMTMTHFIATNHTESINAIESDQSCYGKKPIMEIGYHKIYPTNYTINKEAAFNAFIHFPILGIGPGMFTAYVDQLKRDGTYPKYFVSFDPHSTYLGTLAETGIIGFIVLLMIVGIVYQYTTQLPSSNGNQLEAIALQCIFLFFFMEGFNLDILHFRHLWVMLGIVSAHYYLSKRTRS